MRWTRAGAALALFAVVAVLGACGDGRRSGAAASAAAAVSSGTTAASTTSSQPTPTGASSSGVAPSGSSTAAGSGPPAAAPPATVASLIQDPSYVPSAPADRPWYSRLDDASTPDNEAARDIARAIAAGGHLDEGFVFDRLVGGGGLAIFVGGNNHEQDSPTRRSGWIRSCAVHVHTRLDLPAIQVDYLNWAAGRGGPADLALYNASFVEGVLRTTALVEKAFSAGVRELYLFGHSKGGDIVQDVTWLRHDEPRLVMAVALGVPLWSACNPDPAGSHRRGGLFRPDVVQGRDWGGKLIVFNRRSDRSVHGEFLPVSSFPGPGHDYSRILADPAFCDLLEQARFQRPRGWEDRSLGSTWDW